MAKRCATRWKEAHANLGHLHPLGAVLSIRGTTEQERAEAKTQDVPAPRHGGTFQKEGRIPFDPHTDFDRIS